MKLAYQVYASQFVGDPELRDDRGVIGWELRKATRGIIMVAGDDLGIDGFEVFAQRIYVINACIWILILGTRVRICFDKALIGLVHIIGSDGGPGMAE